MNNLESRQQDIEEVLANPEADNHYEKVALSVRAYNDTLRQ